jgi:hypothetical protein
MSCLILLLVPYLFVRDGLYQMYQAAIGFNLSVYGDVRDHYDLFQLLRHPLILFALLAIALSVITRLRDPLPWTRNESLLVLYAISGFASLYAMGKFLVYHFDPIFAIAAYLCGYTVMQIENSIRPRWLAVPLIGLLFLFACRSFYPFNLLHYAREAHANGRPLLEYCYEHIKSGKDFGYETETRLVNYVRARNARSLEFASITPALLWRSEVPQASRFTMIHAIGMHRVGQRYTQFQRECQKEYLRVLIEKRPDLYILSTQPTHLQMFGFQDPASIVRALPGVDSLIRSRYIFDTTIGPFECYRLAR